MPWKQDARNQLLKTRDELLTRVAREPWYDRDENRHVEKGTLIQELERERIAEKSLYPEEYIFWAVIVAYVVVQFTLLFAVLAGNWFAVTFSLFEIPVNLGMLVLGLQVVHLLFSLRQVDVDQLVGIDFFGRPAKLKDPGLVLIPLLLLRISSASRNYVDKRYPGPPEKIHRVSAEVAAQSEIGDAPPAGSDKVRPIFVTTGKAKYTPEDLKSLDRGEDEDQYDSQMTIDVALFVRYRPNTEYGGIFRIARNLSRTDFESRANDLLREQMEVNISEIISTQTYSTIIENRELVNEVLHLKTIDSTLRFGIQVDQARTLELNPSHKTSEEQAKSVRSKFRRTQTIVDASAERQKREQEGKGEANAELYRLNALGKGYKRIKKDGEVDGATVIASETAKAALSENADVIVVGAGTGTADLLGILEAGKRVFTRKDGQQPSGTGTKSEETS